MTGLINVYYKLMYSKHNIGWLYLYRGLNNEEINILMYRPWHFNPSQKTSYYLAYEYICEKLLEIREPK